MPNDGPHLAVYVSGVTATDAPVDASPSRLTTLFV